jgi:GABA permease
MTLRLLVIANETAPDDELRDVVAARAAGRDTEVMVIAPALAGRLAFWTSDDGRARREARQRVTRCLSALRAAGLTADGAVGDASPLLAIGDALRVFDADEVLIATHPPGDSNWLERGVVSRARARFSLPIHHLVVEGDRLLRHAAA